MPIHFPFHFFSRQFRVSPGGLAIHSFHGSISGFLHCARNNRIQKKQGR
jgi:hypothetical protein